MRILLGLVTLWAHVAHGAPVDQGPPNVPEFRPSFAGQTRAQALVPTKLETEVVVGGLANPWGIAGLPDGGFLMTERPGRMRFVDTAWRVSDPIRGLPEVAFGGQGGLLDVAVSPDFATDRMVYWTYAKPVRGGYATAAARGVLSLDATRLTDVRDIFVQSPASRSRLHYGSRILFAPDGAVFVTLGEHSTRAERGLAQDVDTTFGKVVRIEKTGTIPAENPFGNAVWSLGHRNPQGADIRPSDGALWVIEHGPAGGDELNRIRSGANYGWPVISYGENYDGSPIGQGITARQGMEQPRYYWDPVIAPSGMQFYDGDLFADWRGDLLIASLNPGGLVRLKLRGDRVTGEERLLRGQARIRDVEVAPDGAVLLLLDDPRNGAILRLTPG